MSKVFLDTNFFFDIFQRDVTKAKQLTGQEVFSSPLSYHIFSYTNKLQMPNQALLNSLGTVGAVSLNEEVLIKSLQGPTSDLEDNIQLNSAAQEACDYFLTKDKRLLKMKYYGKTEIVNKLAK